MRSRSPITGSYADRVGRNIAASYVPEQYYSAVTNVRDATAQGLLQQQVTNPFNIANFAALAVSNPALYQRMAGNAFFTAATTQRQNLVRAFPQFAGVFPTAALVYANLPLGIVKDHALEVNVTRRYASGLSANLAFAARRVTENRTVELYDREPTMRHAASRHRRRLRTAAMGGAAGAVLDDVHRGILAQALRQFAAVEKCGSGCGAARVDAVAGGGALSRRAGDARPPRGVHSARNALPHRARRTSA